MQTKPQYILLKLIDDLSVKDISKLYFNNTGIGYLKRLMTGEAKPNKILWGGLLKNVPKKYHDDYDKYVNTFYEFKGW